MTPNQREVLESLNGGGWLRPLDFGGHNGSHHGLTARRMADTQGWVEWKYQGHEIGEKTRDARGSCVYRITEKGVTALMNDRATHRLARAATL